MADVRLSAFAEANLIEIYDYTEAVFGEYQAEGIFRVSIARSACWPTSRASVKLSMIFERVIDAFVFNHILYFTR